MPRTTAIRALIGAIRGDYRYSPSKVVSPSSVYLLSLIATIGSLTVNSTAVSQHVPLSSSCSVDAFQLLKNWVQNCQDGHEECRKTISGEVLEEDRLPTLPTRVIDVGEPSDCSPPHLIETHDNVRGHWIALSHCWGSSEHRPPITTSINLKHNLIAIPIEHLPKTFIDAITVTRALGVRYLWIDSLCILQDDEDDWRREAKRMGDVYECAFLVIAASSANDSRDGCFFRRWYEPFADKHISIPFWGIGQNRRTTIQSGQGSANATLAVKLEWRQPKFGNSFDPMRSPLSRRGWATQEWILSRRIVHFLKDGMVWGCKTIGMDERGVDDNDTNAHYRHLHLSTERSNWVRIMCEHSGRKFTYPTDTLISLDGLAVKMAIQRQGKYHYGLWSGQLPGQLLWFARGTFANSALLNVPSWSWASRIGEVGAVVGRWENNDKFFDLSKVHVISESGCLRASSSILPFRITLADDLSESDPWTGLSISIPKSRYWLDTNYAPVVHLLGYSEMHDGLYRMYGQFTGTPKGVAGWAYFDDGPYNIRYGKLNPHLHEPAYFLVLGRYVYASRSEKFQPEETLCGVLLQASDPGKDVFRRVGIAGIKVDCDRWQREGIVATVTIV